MIHTLDFIFSLQRDAVLREKVYALMLQPPITEFDFRGWHLSFDSSKERIIITSNNTDEYLSAKFCPAEMKYYTLYALVEQKENRDDSKMYFKCLS